MEKIRLYLVAVTSAAILCGLISSFFPKGNAASAVIKLLCGLVMSIVFLSPLIDFSFSDYESFWDSITQDAQAAAGQGTAFYNESYKAIIKEETEAYILDKAADLGLSISAQVELTETEVPVPNMVTLTGNVSPLLREKLTNQMCNELGITREQLKWN